MVPSQAFEFDPAVIEEIANRVGDAIVTRLVEMLSDEKRSTFLRQPMPWLDAREVARRLGVSRDWVYEHAKELGGTRVGAGNRPRLRFPPDVVDSRRSKPAPPATNGESREQRPERGGLIAIHAS
jgi:predicted DNA-binding transcriptional regulator AlpA